MFDYLMGSTSLLEAAGGFNGPVSGMTAEEDAFMESIQSIPCMDDPEDAFDRINLETVENFYAITNAITVDEFAHYVATNEEVVYEEGKIKEIMNGIKTWILNAWAKVKGVFEKALDYISGIVRNDKKFLEKYEKDIIKCKSYEVEKGYDMDWGTVSDESYITALVKTFKVFTEDIYSVLEGHSDSNASSGLDNFNIYNAAKGDDNKITADDVVKVLRSVAVSGRPLSDIDIADVKQGITEEEFNKKLKDLFLREKTKVTLQASDVISEIKDAKTARAVIKKVYGDAKRFFNNMIKDADGVGRVAKVADKKGYKENKLAASIGKFNSVCKSCIGIATKIKKAQLKGINKLYNQARHAGVLMAKKANGDNKDKKDDDKKDAKNESSMLAQLMFI